MVDQGLRFDHKRRILMRRKVDIKELEQKACQIRLELLRMFSHGKFHHFGGSFSCVELVTALYFYQMLPRSLYIF